MAAVETLNESDHQAIHYFEMAIEKESHGSMSDAIEFYRKAFKINEKVDLLYRNHKVPLKVKQLREKQGENSVIKVDEDAVNKINVDELLRSFEHIECQAPKLIKPPEEEPELSTKIAQLDLKESSSKLVNEISPLIKLPNDLWVYIFEILVVKDPESWINLCLTCKKFAYLGLSNDIWRQLCYLVYPKQNYEENQGFDELPIPKDQLKILPSYKNSWKYMLSNRPFIKFNGCYISVVNYYSEGGRAEFSNSWSNPVRTVTYYRYLRFYPDGTCVKVLTALEPYRVIPYLSKHNKTRSILSVYDQVKQHGSANIPTSIQQVKEGYRIYHGSWTISTTGEVHINLNEGSVPYYDFHYHFQVKSLSKIFKYNKLNWVRYFTIRKQVDENDDDDRIGDISELSLGKEKAFKFSRVKSYSAFN